MLRITVSNMMLKIDTCFLSGKMHFWEWSADRRRHKVKAHIIIFFAFFWVPSDDPILFVWKYWLKWHEFLRKRSINSFIGTDLNLLSFLSLREALWKNVNCNNHHYIKFDHDLMHYNKTYCEICLTFCMLKIKIK